jgi:hypothetical protein
MSPLPSQKSSFSQMKRASLQNIFLCDTIPHIKILPAARHNEISQKLCVSEDVFFLVKLLNWEFLTLPTSKILDSILPVEKS